MFSIFNKVKKTVNNPSVKNPIQSTSDLDKHVDADEEYREDNTSFISVDSAEEESSQKKLIVSTCIDSSDVISLKLHLGILDSGPKQPILKVNIILEFLLIIRY